MIKLLSVAVAIFCFAINTLQEAENFFHNKCETYQRRSNDFPVNVNDRRRAAVGEFPSLVALGNKNEENSYDFYCGGFLITENFVVTAARCATSKISPITIARFGKVNFY